MKEAALSEFYRKINPVFTEVKKLIHLLLTYPITSNEAERSFSKLKLLLASTRSSMGEARLNNLALMGTHKSRLSNISTESIIQKFKEKPRHAKLDTKILSDNKDEYSDNNTDDEGSFYLSFIFIKTFYMNFACHQPYTKTRCKNIFQVNMLTPSTSTTPSKSTSRCTTSRLSLIKNEHLKHVS